MKLWHVKWFSFKFCVEFMLISHEAQFTQILLDIISMCNLNTCFKHCLFMIIRKKNYLIKKKYKMLHLFSCISIFVFYYFKTCWINYQMKGKYTTLRTVNIIRVRINLLKTFEKIEPNIINVICDKASPKQLLDSSPHLY